MEKKMKGKYKKKGKERYVNGKARKESKEREKGKLE